MLKESINDDTWHAFVALQQKAGSANSGLLPLTVKMISQAVQKPSDDNFYIDGLDINNVSHILELSPYLLV